MKHNFLFFLAGSLPILLTISIAAQVSPDSALLTEINKIKAVDNHAHPLPFLKEGEKDVDFDVPESIPPLAPPVRLRPTNPEYLEAWNFLYGYKYKDTSDAHMRELAAMKRRVMNEKGDAYPAWVLDKLGIEMMFASNKVMGRGLNAPRFLWVWDVNPLLFPLNNEEGKKIFHLTLILAILHAVEKAANFIS